MTVSFRRSSWVLGAAGLALAMLGWALQPGRFHYAWLAALATWLGWPLGSMALLLIHRLTGGRWGEVLAPVLRAGTATLPLLLPALIPLVLGLGVYPWARPGAVLPNHLYLNTPFFLARLAIYCVLWLAMAGLTLFGRRPQAVAAAGLPVLALSFTFAVFDLTMSLDPSFNSSAYGLIQGTAAVLLALSIAAIPAALVAPRAVLAEIGKLLLCLVVLWAYLDFMQLLIVWESNLPSEAPYYARRMTGGWGVVLVAIAVLHFLAPFAVLMLPRVQRSRGGIAGVAALLIALEVLRGWWTVLPQAGRVSWIDVACLAAFAGIGAGIGAGYGAQAADMIGRRHV